MLLVYHDRKFVLTSAYHASGTVPVIELVEKSSQVEADRQPSRVPAMS
jgi:hypothetical protein